MPQGLSRVIEVRQHERAGSSGGGSASEIFKSGHYEFDLVKLRQTNLATRTERRIRQGGKPKDEWQALQEAHGRLQLELAECRRAGAAQEASRQAAAEELRRAQEEIGLLRSTGKEAADALRASQEALRLSGEREAEAERSRKVAEGELARARAKLILVSEKAKELETSSGRAKALESELAQCRRRVDELGDELRGSAERAAGELAAAQEELRLSRSGAEELARAGRQAAERLARALGRLRDSRADTRQAARDRDRLAHALRGRRVRGSRLSRQLAEANGELAEAKRALAASNAALAAAARKHGESARQAHARLQGLSEDMARVTQERDAARSAEAARKSEAEALAARDRATAFQGAAQLLMQACRPDAVRLPCPAGPPAPGASGLSLPGLLGSFRAHVETAFLGTRAAHRKKPGSAEFCPPPEYEILSVSALVNPELADRFRGYVQRSRAGEPSWDHALTARRVARPLAGMRLLSLSAGAARRVGAAVGAAGGGGGGGRKKEEEGGGWDEAVLLGWHGASDEAVDSILQHGFNPCCAGNGAGTLLGRGIYFAENSSKADLYAGPRERRFARRDGPMTVVLSALFCGNMYEATREDAKGMGMGQWIQPPSPTDAQRGAAGIRR